MEIRRVEYKGVYGSLSGNLQFRHGENFLVGINGCGKTTVLNLVRWVLGPSLPHLCTLQHELIRIQVKHGRYLYSIQSRIAKGKHELSVKTRDKSCDFKPIRTPLPVHPREIGGEDDLQEARSLYRHLRPEAHEVVTWNFLIEKLPSPVFVGLERSIEERGSDRTVNRTRRHPGTLEISTALATATGLMRDAFNATRRRLVQINDRLNCRVLELSFSGVLRGSFTRGVHSRGDTAEKIRQLKARFETSAAQGSYSKALSAEGVRAAVVKYLDELSSLLDSDDKEEKIWLLLNQHNFDRAADMFDLFEEHELQAQEVQQEIGSFVEAVNRFISDSGKRIHFDEDTGTPYFSVPGSSERLRLSQLSSGESQVVILLSYFAFLAKEGIPIVIDEPELSLHVQWQAHFVSAVKAVMPKGCQTIMATHSPEICGADDVNVQAISVRAAQ